jgi:hypothetical protein
MEELEDNKSWVHQEPFQYKKPTAKSPDVNLLQKVWVPTEKCYMYFPKKMSEKKIMKRLELYKMRDKYFGYDKFKTEE